jgi:hypothetical protein
MNEFEVRNEKAKLVAVCPTADMAFRMVKHDQPDGDYSIVGPGVDCTVTRSKGTVYPTSGKFPEGKVDPRSLAEAKEAFNS